MSFSIFEVTVKNKSRLFEDFQGPWHPFKATQIKEIQEQPFLKTDKSFIQAIKICVPLPFRLLKAKLCVKRPAFKLFIFDKNKKFQGDL